ncbi:acyl transferase/acyl hydrolase/lysophospholipase [Aspergillus bertholletiae]|uniref:Acyl transferase/acyl hydrolase/lysophospholipase n=1 Tax=Aspergillus bertholletiae TaxID=1226010 RepID=A0A5N7APW9_9EURO|nr:acyl transferase/acyl hydrolase/lysophospholipase [Aspergillus bertholletiae]
MPGRGLALLSLDGGGARGLSSLYILKNLMEQVAKAKGLEVIPKPCDFFDMIGGTSTGGLIAIMLGHLHMSINECISAYLGIAEPVFTPIRRLPISLGLTGNIENAIKDMLKARGLDEEALFYDSSRAIKCKVQVRRRRRSSVKALTHSPSSFVCAIQSEIKTPTILKNYEGEMQKDTDRLKYIKIWQAARATSAASGFFRPSRDLQLWNEACDVFLGDQDRLDDHLDCLISIGTGKPTLNESGTNLQHVAKALVDISIETEQTACAFQQEHQLLEKDGRYCRLTVENGLQDVYLEEYQKTDRIIAATKGYLINLDTIGKLTKCITAMKEHRVEDQQPSDALIKCRAGKLVLRLRNIIPQFLRYTPYNV